MSREDLETRARRALMRTTTSTDFDLLLVDLLAEVRLLTRERDRYRATLESIRTDDTWDSLAELDALIAQALRNRRPDVTN